MADEKKNIDEKTELFNMKTMFKKMAENQTPKNGLVNVNSMIKLQTQTNQLLTDIQSALKVSGNQKEDDRAKTKSFVKKEDPMKRQIKELNDIEQAIRDGQKMDKKKGNGLLAILGGLLTVGGL